MCLRIDWGRAIQPARGAVIMPSVPAVVSKPPLMPRLEVNLRSKKIGGSWAVDMGEARIQRMYILLYIPGRMMKGV